MQQSFQAADVDSPARRSRLRPPRVARGIATFPIRARIWRGPRPGDQRGAEYADCSCSRLHTSAGRARASASTFWPRRCGTAWPWPSWRVWTSLTRRRSRPSDTRCCWPPARSRRRS